MATEPYQQFQERIIREARRAQEAGDAEFARQRLHVRAVGWAEGYEQGKAEQAERDISKRWHDAIFAFLVGGIAGFLTAAILSWLAK